MLEEKLYMKGYEVLDHGTIRVFENLNEPERINRELIFGGVDIRESYLAGQDLEGYFMDLLGGKENENLANGTMGLIVTEDSMSSLEESVGNIFDEVGIIDVLLQIYGTGFSAIATSVFICIFVLGEYGNGAIKNVVGKGDFHNFCIYIGIQILLDLGLNGIIIVISECTRNVGAGAIDFKDSMSYSG